MRSLTYVALLLIALAALPGTAAATSRVSQFAAAFTCGVNPAQVRSVPGFYAASVAILNSTGREAEVEVKIALNFPPAALEPGAVTPSVSVTLAPDEAFGVDCQEILDPAVFGLEIPKYAQGYVVVESHRRGLTVTATQTVAELVDDGPGLPAGIAIERVEERRIRR